MKIKNTFYTSLNTRYRISKTFPKYFYFGKVFSYAFLFAVISISLYSCKDPGLVGVDVQPEQDKFSLQYSNHFNITSHTIQETATRTDETNYNLLGSIIDPVFGKSEASFMCQFLLSKDAFDFTYTKNGIVYQPTIDSVVLSMVYINYYGDTTSANGTQQVNVYELKNDISVDNIYYSDFHAFDYYDVSNPIATYTFQPKPYSLTKVDSIYRAPQLRIQLDKNVFGEKIMGREASTQLLNNTNFLNYFKGLYITTSNSNQQNKQGAILYFNMLATDSKITAYYHNGTFADTQKKSFTYQVGSSSSARINLFHHDYSSVPELRAQFTNAALGQSTIYVQAMDGLRSKIELPFLDSLSALGSIAINKAEIIFKVESFDSKFVPNTKLFLFGIDSVGNKVYLPDQSENTSFLGDYYGGYYDATNKQYRFNIARYVQLVITKKITDRGLYLVTGTTYETANRVALKGGKNIQFNLTYTKL